MIDTVEKILELDKFVAYLIGEYKRLSNDHLRGAVACFDSYIGTVEGMKVNKPVSDRELNSVIDTVTLYSSINRELSRVSKKIAELKEVAFIEEERWSKEREKK